MNGERRDELLKGIADMALRAEVEQFAAMPTDEQLVHLYLAVRQPRGLRGHVVNAGYTTLAVGLLAAYQILGGSWPL